MQQQGRIKNQILDKIFVVGLLSVLFFNYIKIDGDDGRGKSLSLIHVLHYCFSAGWFILPVPSGKIWVLVCN